jgi:branched-chain amino acid transport system substrate-binding protein
VMSAAVQRAGQEYVNGAISTGYLKNPTNAKYRRDSAVRQYNQLMTKYAPNANRNDTFYYYGFAKAYDVVKLLYAAGKNPTRESLMAATKKMNWANPYMIKGVVSKTSKSDNFPLDQVKIVRYNNGSWNEASNLFKGR